MKLKNKDEWQRVIETNKDDYSSCCVRYAQRWAERMEELIANGNRLEDIADQTSHKANTEGITGFMYGCAVDMLSRCWEYGEELRVWHNLKTQLGHEGEEANKSGGVLNPALLSMEVKK